jgi:putative acetyltransferase
MPDASIRVRAAEPGDAEAIHAIFMCPLAQANTLQLPFRSVEFRRQRLAQADANTHTLVAEVESRIVGILGLHVEAGPRRHGVASFGMAVHDEFQNRGVGSALLTAMLELGENWLGLRRIELTVYTDNSAAVHLYEKFGFVIEGTAKRYALRGGEYVDAFHMARLRS